MNPSTGSTWEGEAPAKVNLFLRVLAREETDFHQIETLFQAIELSDRVRLTPGGPSGVTLEVAGAEPDGLGAHDENLTARAARAFIGAMGNRGAAAIPGIAIHLEKRIPVGAGLGGGSSDAATVLLGMNALHGHPIPEAELLRLGGRLGSDVPFFLTCAPLALAWGRGDRLLPLPSLPPRPVVLAVPPFPVATPRAYEAVARMRAAQAMRRDPAALSSTGLGSWDGVASSAENDFEAALFSEIPQLAELRSQMGRAGAEPALLSGSGSVVFGVFKDDEAADRGHAHLRAALPSVRLIRTRTRSG